MMEEFITWEDKVKPEIGHIGAILSEKLSDEPEALINDIKDVEAWNARCGFLLAEANSFLDRFCLSAMPSKEGRTETERKVTIDSLSSPIRMVRDVLEHYCDCIKQRLILGESILSFQKQFQDRKPAEKFEVF